MLKISKRRLSFALTLLLAGTSVQAGCIDAFMTGLQNYDEGQRSSKGTFRANELLVLCFQANTGGHVSIWDAPNQGDFEQIYPNLLTHPSGETHAKVSAGKQYCFGTPGTFPMYHPESEGDGGKISITLTAKASDQLSTDSYAIPGQRVKRGTMEKHLRSHSRTTGNCTGRDVTYINYRVTP